MIEAQAIKAIPATYNGVQFRSRTEARWAVFFDALGVRWEYEHEGYQLPSGWYLPDFWLPEVSGGMFAEIKPRRAPSERETKAIKELAAATGKTSCIFPGAPHEWSEDADNERIPWAQLGDFDDLFVFWVSSAEVLFCYAGEWPRDGFVADFDRLRAALESARRHRFW